MYISIKISLNDVFGEDHFIATIIPPDKRIQTPPMSTVIDFWSLSPFSGVYLHLDILNHSGRALWSNTNHSTIIFRFISFFKQVLRNNFLNASEDLRTSRFHETNGQAHLRRVPAFAREFDYHNHCVSFVVNLPNKILI